MTVAEILRTKGSDVKLASPDETALAVAARLRSEQIGALVVSTDGHTIDGIISERDIAYALAAYDRLLPDVKVSALMEKSVIVCAPEDSIVKVMKLMSRERIRHIPVKSGGRLVGIVSIGDVLKYRLGEVQLEADVLRDYAIASRH